MTASLNDRKKPTGLVAAIVALFFSLALLLPSPALSALQNEQVLETRPVAEGLVLEKRSYTAGSGPVLIYILRADLSNPYLKINTLVGADGTLNKNSAVTAAAAGAGAVAAVNADFFQMMESGRPVGMTYKDGRMAASPPLRDDMYGWAVTSAGVPLIEIFNFSGGVTAKNGAKFPLSGINKPSYIQSGERNSHDGTLLMYNRFWGKTSRGKIDGNDSVVEVFVNSGAVTEILFDQPGKAIPENGFVLAGRGSAAQYIKTNIKVGDRLTVDYKVTPEGDRILAGTGGWSLLVDKKKVMGNFPADISGPNARTALGYSPDKRRLLVVTVEKSSASRGLTLQELADYMAGLGVERALNLDGGGSTTLAARSLGEEKPVLVNRPQREVQRLVPTALGFFSSAPRSSLSGLVLKGPDAVFPGDTVSYTLLGYDTHYNPVTMNQDNTSWTLVSGPGSLAENVFTGRKSGSAVISASSGGITVTRTVRVLGSRDLKKLTAAPASITVKPGSTVNLKVSAVDLEGTVYNLSPKNYSVSVSSRLGIIENGVFSAPAAPVTGEIKISLDSTTVVVPVEVKEDRVPVNFKDMTGHWAAGPVSRLSAAGVVSGYPGNIFAPDKEVTRAEFLVMTCKAMGWQPAGGEINFSDNSSIPLWSKGYIITALQKSAVTGYEDRTFRPSSQVTRAEMAAIISRALSLPPAQNTDPAAVFTDGKTIASWASGPVSRVYASGIMKGDSEKRFRPGDKAKRAESAAVIDSAVSYLNRK